MSEHPPEDWLGTEYAREQSRLLYDLDKTALESAENIRQMRGYLRDIAQCAAEIKTACHILVFCIAGITVLFILRGCT